MSVERVVVEWLDGHGRVQWRERLALGEGRRSFTIGRSVEADVTLDDPHAAGLHAAVEIADGGRLLASDLGSVNGLIVCGKRWRDARGLELADNMLQIGRTRLRLRTTHERLGPERPYELPASALARGPGWIAAVAGLACVLQLLYATWLTAPRDFAVSAVSLASVVLAVAAGWVGLWGLLSRVMLGEWRWLRHGAIGLGVFAAFIAVRAMVDLGGFVLALPPPGNSTIWLGATALAGALFLHLTHASPLPARRAALIACGIPALLAAGSHWFQAHDRVRDVNHIGARMRIYPPALRLRAADKLEDYFNQANALRERADKRLADALADEPGNDGEN
jgi:FHA domain